MPKPSTPLPLMTVRTLPRARTLPYLRRPPLPPPTVGLTIFEKKRSGRTFLKKDSCSGRCIICGEGCFNHVCLFRDDVDSDLHKEELPDWMSHLFQKLDLEVNEDSICSTGKVTQVETETHPLGEDDISSEIHLSSELKDSSMFQKMDSEANEDIYCSFGDVTHVDTNQLVDGGFSAEIHGPSEAKDSTMDKVDASGLDDDSALLGWIVGLLKKGGHDDVLSQFDLDQVETNSMCYDVPDEVTDLDMDVEDSHKSMKRVSHKETLEKGIKWMSEECFLAFTKSEERNRFEGIEHKFGELRSQCLSIEAYDKIFHHYNFTIEAKHGGSDAWSSGLYFAEVKQLFGLKSYFCCLLEPLDDGWCYGCQNQNVGDLQHPSKDGYEEGHADICWPFVDQTDSDSDDDCGLGYIT
ncbi:hypothetical protein EJB05_51878 [Eragrostis curvula]|uniref:DUF3615 domain-containing protein n=1 Tax=Eragrostis curvula TaxID=38414 RepID=A0A5J9SUD7_9POAL|nr:hypothetical protein EJB05_51878 [Eragrostis curvula]